eukprot:scaffold12470_cov119-Isochrysis_galbana.AAC.9
MNSLKFYSRELATATAQQASGFALRVGSGTDFYLTRDRFYLMYCPRVFYYPMTDGRMERFYASRARVGMAAALVRAIRQSRNLRTCKRAANRRPSSGDVTNAAGAAKPRQWKMKATTRTLATVTKVAVSLRAGTRGWGRRQGQGREEPCGGRRRCGRVCRGERGGGGPWVSSG